MKSSVIICFIAVCSVGTVAQTQEVVKPKVYMVADAHLDSQWNWDVQTTIKEYVWNTLNQNLFLLSKYPDYIFNFEGGVKYSWMKEYYPREYEMMKKYIKQGRWHISGASWEASDALVPSTESFIRNILQGQEYYRQEFGVESTDIFLPDCFGFGWTLPTIANHCGLIGFSSQKLDWRNHPFYVNSKHPFKIGLWQGIDGSKIMLAHGYDYGRKWPDSDLSENPALIGLSEQSPIKTVYRYYGTGDTGGSPTISSVKAVEKGITGHGPLKIISATSDQLYKDFMPYSSHPELEVFDGELLMDVHGTGCYTSQAAMKLYNRQNELLGDAAERASVTASLISGSVYPSVKLTEAWRRFLWHQFHDDLTGTSIPRAYEFSWNDELLSLKQFSDILNCSVGNVVSKMDTRVKGLPVVLFNPLGYPVSDILEVSVNADVNPKSVIAVDYNGKVVPSQLVGYKDGKAKILIEANVPAIGYAVYDIRLNGKSIEKKEGTQVNALENSVYRLTLDKNGDITSLYDKLNNKELVKTGKNIRLALFPKNESHSWPAWEIIKETVDAEPKSITDDVEIALVENGDLRKTLKVSKRYGDSKFVQYISLYEGPISNRIDFKNEIDWMSTNTLLKAEFPLNVENEKATYDLGIGAVERGNNTVTAYEVYAQQWADLTDKNGSYGITILNDSKYGWDKPNDNTIRLTLIHTPGTRRNYSYQNRQDFGHHEFTYSLVGHSGKLDRTIAVKNGEILNQKLKAYATSMHDGPIGKSYSFASTDADNVVIKALKKAESSDDLIIRVYETAGKQTNANIIFEKGIISASQADGSEKTIAEANFSGNKLAISINPNSIQTYKLKLGGEIVKSPECVPLSLKMDKRCYSWNEFKGNGNFESGYSYAAELIPTQIMADNVVFDLKPAEEFNGMTCKGDTIKLNGQYDKLYLLVASTNEIGTTGEFAAGKSLQKINVPFYSGFIGQWGHVGHTTGFLKDDYVAFVGTHRHSLEGDHPYEYTYMFMKSIEIPKGVREVILPDNKNLVIFAATAVAGKKEVSPVSIIYKTAIDESSKSASEFIGSENLLSPDKIIDWSGFVNDREKPSFVVDGNETTKWCDVEYMPAYIDFDLGTPVQISRWSLLNAGEEAREYITSDCYVLGKENKDDKWQTIDFVKNNKSNRIVRSVRSNNKLRYIRLMVTGPNQSKNSITTRVYEFGVYK